jgi:hypothetical protein
MSFLGTRPDSLGVSSTAYDHFSGDTATTTFTLSRSVSANSDIQVVVNNVIQDPGVAYFVTNLNTLTFTSPPSAAYPNNISVVYRQFVQTGIAPGANTVTMSAIAANTIQPWQLSNSLLTPVVDIFTANGTGTTFVMSAIPPSANSVAVTLNGLTQSSPIHYSVNGNVITFTSAPAGNSLIKTVQQSMVGSSIVPVDGSVTTSKYAPNSIPSTAYINNTIPNTAIVSVANTQITGTIVPTQLSTGAPSWNASGNVGIGTSSPAGRLTVVGPNNAGISIDQGNYNYYGAYSHVFASSGYATPYMTIDNNGQVILASATSKIIGGTNAGRMVMTNADQTTYAIAYGSAYSGTPNQFTVVTNTSYVTTFNPNGTLVLNGGNNSATGTGIAFPATQSASSDANTLDDYEKGTWTPVITSATGTITSYTSNGYYTKIGNVVNLVLYVSLTTVGTAGGVMGFTGAPFATGTPTGFIQFCSPSRESNSTGVIYYGYIAGGGYTNGTIQASNGGAIAWANSYKYSFLITYTV